jgi:hypothetical protein
VSPSRVSCTTRSGIKRAAEILWSSTRTEAWRPRISSASDAGLMRWRCWWQRVTRS